MARTALPTFPVQLKFVPAVGRGLKHGPCVLFVGADPANRTSRGILVMGAPGWEDASACLPFACLPRLQVLKEKLWEAPAANQQMQGELQKRGLAGAGGSSRSGGAGTVGADVSNKENAAH